MAVKLLLSRPLLCAVHHCVTVSITLKVYYTNLSASSQSLSIDRSILSEYKDRHIDVLTPPQDKVSSGR